MSEFQAQPFNIGEIEVQTRLGVHQQVMSYAPRVIRDFLPAQHRAFFAQLPLLFTGSIDAQKRPWASAVFGQPGFIQSPEPKVLRIQSTPTQGDPLNDNLKPGAALGFLGLEHHTRRRNRLSGKVSRRDSTGFEITVDQSFGNCPRYIHARSFEVLPEAEQRQDPVVKRFKKLPEAAKALIAGSRAFFIASYYHEDPGNPSHGADVSHRGGPPGFVRVGEDDSLLYPEFSGNNHYNTLGNIHKNPVAGLLFMDFETGDLLYLTCRAEIIWEGPAPAQFKGAKQLIRLQPDEGVMVMGAMPLRWVSLEKSADFSGLGSWREVAAKPGATGKSSPWSDYRVSRVVSESENIRSFYLEPLDGEPLPPHQGGQFLPVRVCAPGWDKPLTRTYTISSGPGRRTYRISIKREGGDGNTPPGKVSNYFHEHVAVGSVINAGRPRGRFVLDQSQRGPLVFLSAGVGITPMISMLEDLAQRDVGGDPRNIWLFHGAKNSSVHAFGRVPASLMEKLPNLKVVYRYSQPQSGDTIEQGHVDINLLKRILPFDDYRFYICGPVAFMAAMNSGLRALNIAEDRIFYEFFGKGGLAPQKRTQAQKPQTVRFAAADREALWTPEKGSLLDLAEAAGLAPPFGCRSGACATCVTRIISGKVVYADGKPAGIGKDQALICNAQPDPESAEGLVLEL